MAKQDFRSQAGNIKAGFQALFNDASKEEIAKDKIKMLPVSLLDPFKDHPFYVRDNEDMEKLIESIRERGIISPIEVRSKSDGRYEMISGHRRKHACERLGITEMPALIEELDDNEAALRMVDANLHREKILPSEKAFAYRIKMEAMRRQGKRTDLTSHPVGEKLTSAQKTGIGNGDSQNQVLRYICLTYLTPDFLEMTDSEKLPFRTAVELSYLTYAEQTNLLELMEKKGFLPALPQAEELRKHCRTVLPISKKDRDDPEKKKIVEAKTAMTKEEMNAFLSGQTSERIFTESYNLPPLSPEEMFPEEQAEERKMNELAQNTQKLLDRFKQANAAPNDQDGDTADPDFKMTRVKKATDADQTQQLEKRIRKDLEQLEMLYAKQLSGERLIAFRTAYNALLRWFYEG